MSSSKLLDFPCDFPVKIICRNNQLTASDLVKLIKPHWSACRIEHFTARASQHDHYIAFTAHIAADSQQQIDAIYQTLSTHPHIIMVL